jgi:hypothetical protein
MRAGSWSRRIVLILIFVICAAAAVAQETARWIGTAEAQPYAQVADRLVSLAAEVVAERVPERLFLDRLKEGARKRAAPDRLAAALAEDAARLVFAARSVDAAGLRASGSERERVLSDCFLALRASVNREEVSAAIGSVAESGAPPARIGAVIAVLAAVDPGRLVPADARMEFVIALAGSPIPADRIDSVAAAFARGRSYGLHPERIVRLVAAELAAGGNLRSLDEALNKERRKQ